MPEIGRGQRERRTGPDRPISGPGICGAEFPLKVAALGEGSSSFGFADDDLRPPGNHRQPAALADLATAAAASRSPYPDNAMRQPGYGAAPAGRFR